MAENLKNVLQLNISALLGYREVFDSILDTRRDTSYKLAF